MQLISYPRSSGIEFDDWDDGSLTEQLRPYIPDRWEVSIATEQYSHIYEFWLYRYYTEYEEVAEWCVVRNLLDLQWYISPTNMEDLLDPSIEITYIRYSEITTWDVGPFLTLYDAVAVARMYIAANIKPEKNKCHKNIRKPRNS